MTYKDRLIQFIRYEGLSNRRFQEMMGLSNAYIANLQNEPRPGIVKRIRETFPNCNTEWLRTGEGEMLLPVSDTPTVPPIAPNPEEQDNIVPSTPAISANAYSLLAQVDVLNAIVAELREANQRLKEANAQLTEASQRKDEMMFQLFEMFGGRNPSAATTPIVPTPATPAP